MCRLRSMVLVLGAATFLTCLVSLRWFFATEQFDTRTIQASPHPEVSAWNGVGEEMSRRSRGVDDACGGPVMGGKKGNVKGRNNMDVSFDPAMEELLANPSMLSNLIVDDKNHILYCYVPKVACTNWKRVMLILSGGSNQTVPLSIPPDSVHRKNVFTKLSDLDTAGIRHRLQTYTKFLFVRHPIERVLSAFRNKFEKNYTSSAYFKKRFGVKIIKKYRSGINPEDAPATGDGVKFSEFVSYLIDTKVDQFNEHWAPVSNMCHPCAVRYQILGKYETLAEDSEYILQKVGAPSWLHFPTVVPSKTTAFVGPYFDSLTKQQQQDLIRIYKDDFRIFGYHFRNLV